jgi:hypothetical protein
MLSNIRSRIGFDRLACVFALSAAISCLLTQNASAQATGRPSRIPAPIRQAAYVEDSLSVDSVTEPYYRDSPGFSDESADETAVRGWVPNDQRLDWAARTGAWDMQPAAPAHTVIRPPKPTATPGHAAGGHSGPQPETSAGSGGSAHIDPPKYPLLDGYRSLHHAAVDGQAAIPGAAAPKTAWKQPYSYGYFGASGKRHWSKHHGYRDRATEWRYR